MVIFLTVLSAIGLICFLGTGLIRFLTVPGLFILAYVMGAETDKKDSAAGKVLKKSRFAARIIIPLLISSYLMMWTPLGMHTTHIWLYRVQRAYLSLFNSAPKWFPDVPDDVESGFRFDHLASVMQGTGHESLRFVTTPEQAAEYQAQFSAMALYERQLPEYKYADAEIPESARDAFHSEGWDGTGDIYCDWDFWYPTDTGGDPDAVVYYLDARGNRNHPASSVVILNVRTGAVEFSQYGYTKLAFGK